MTQVPQVPGDVSQSDLINNTNKLVAELNNRDTVQIYKGDDGTQNMLIGKKPNGKRGILIYDNNEIVLDFGQKPSGKKGILVYDNGVPIIDFGQLENGTNGMKVAQNGVDVTTADDDQLVFNSANNVFKIAMSGSVDISVSGSGPAQGTANIAHNLGYSPIIIGSVKLPAGLSSETVAFPGSYATYSGGLFRIREMYEYFAADNNTATLQIRSDIATGTYTVQYYVLVETGAD